MGHLSTPHGRSTGTTGRAASERQGELPAVAHAPMPSPPRKCLVASTRPAHQTASGRVYFLNTTSPSVAYLSHLFPGNCSCVPSFNGRPSPDAPPFPPQLIAACPPFSISLWSLVAFSFTCQKYGGLVSPCAPACRSRAVCVVHLHGRKRVSLYHPPSHSDLFRQLERVRCKFDSSNFPTRSTAPAVQ